MSGLLYFLFIFFREGFLKIGGYQFYVFLLGFLLAYFSCLEQGVGLKGVNDGPSATGRGLASGGLFVIGVKA